MKFDLLVAALMVSPTYLFAVVGPLAGFLTRHLWILGIVTVAHALWTALESFTGDSWAERWRNGLLNEGLSMIPAAAFWFHVLWRRSP